MFPALLAGLFENNVSFDPDSLGLSQKNSCQPVNDGQVLCENGFNLITFDARILNFI